MLKPIRDQIVIEPIEQPTQSAGGIVLPGSALEKPFKGKVVAANSEFTMPDGSVKSCEVEVGDTVYFGKTHGTEIPHEGKKLLVVSEEFILCKE